MRIFVFEYITGGGMLDRPLPASLAREGDLMRDALVSDLSELADIELCVTGDPRLSDAKLPVACRLIQGPAVFQQAWNEALDAADAVWPIAPEHFGTLERISAAVVARGRILLNSPPAAVHMAASKLATLRWLAAAGVPVVPTYGDVDAPPETSGRWVLKPDDGVGCMDMRLFQDRDSLRREWERLPAGRPYLVQPFVDGVAASLCLIAKDGEAALLSINRQRIALMDDALVLLGCVVNGLQVEDPSPYERLAGDIAAALPELWGYVGVDLMVTPNGAQVLEVNPRLTTSYVGLKESIGVNPAELVLGLLRGRPTRRAVWSPCLAVDVCLDYAGVG
jgi:predicted ATP-grasp superfamily ATP-dependent carboligase